MASTSTAVAPTICLGMIVKNESKIIARCIASAAPVVDTFCIIDTGSTDDTVALLEQCKEKYPHFADAQIHQSTFVNFCVNRTEVLDKARGMADYVLLLDADFVLQVDLARFDKRQLTHDHYLVEQYNHATSYYNTRLVRNTKLWKYEGVTHECVHCINPPHTTHRLGNEFRIHDIGDGGSKHDKYTRDYRLLRQGLRDEPDNNRYMFYLGETCRNLQKYDEAVYWYGEAVKKNGWEEEMFYARMQVARCMKARGDAEHKWIEKFLGAHTYRPTRVEPLYDLVRWCREKGLHAMGASFARRAFVHRSNGTQLLPLDALLQVVRKRGDASQLPLVMGRPKDLLFVTYPVYEYQFADEALVCASYSGDTWLARNCGVALLYAWDKVPKVHRKRIACNLQFAFGVSAERAKEIVAECTQLEEKVVVVE